MKDKIVFQDAHLYEILLHILLSLTLFAKTVWGEYSIHRYHAKLDPNQRSFLYFYFLYFEHTASEILCFPANSTVLYRNWYLKGIELHG